MKKLIIFTLFMLQVWIATAQRNPQKEILVFFTEGAALETKIQNDKTITLPVFSSEILKQNLLRLGLTESSFEPANPRFVEADTLKVLADGTRLQQLNMTKLFRLRVDDDDTRNTLIKELNKIPEVLYAEQNGTVTPYLIPSDDRFNEQWGLRNTIFPGRDIHAEQAWDIFTGNPTNIIAIVDGGVDVNHEDLNEKVTGGDTGFGWGGHGIHVAGIAAAESNNGQGVSGVDWNAQIHPQRIDNVQDDVDTYNAIVDAVNFSPNVHVLNHSWGLTFPDESPGRNSITVRQAFALAYKANRTSVVAMGNHQQTNPGVVAFPAGFDNVIAVGASNIQDVVAGFSARGNHIDVAAPGVTILSTFTGGGYGNNSGTSMATPHVSGIASLLKGFNANLSNDDIENIIRLSADDLDNPGAGDGTTPGFDQSSGAGRVNAERALGFLVAPFSLNRLSSQGGTTFGSPTNYYNVLFLTAAGLSSAWYSVQRYEVRKSVTFPQSYCQFVGAWGRGVGTTGWSVANPNYGEGFCEVVPGTLTSTGAVLRTYVYKVYTILGQYVGWYPTSPGNVTFQYSVLGIPNPNAGISGPSLVCDNGQYSFQTMPQGATGIYWQSNNPTNFPINSNGLATRVDGFNGGVSIWGTYLGGVCNGVTMTKPVHVGLPTGQISGPSTVYPGQVYTYNGTFHDGTYAFEWSVNGGGSIFAGGSPNSWVSIYWNTDGSVDLQTTNQCGTTYSSLNVTVSSEGGCDPCQRKRPEDHTGNLADESLEEENISGILAAYPNPSDDIFTVRFNNELEISKPISITIFDLKGQPIKLLSTDKKKFTFSLSEYPTGLYYLRADLPDKRAFVKLIRK